MFRQLFSLVLLFCTLSAQAQTYNTQQYNFQKKLPGGSLVAATPAKVTFPAAIGGCPQGVNGTDTNHYLYISGGTGTAESVLITGGTCISGATSGTVAFTPANNHTGAWGVSTATLGLQEAANDMPAAGGSIDASGLSGSVTLLAPITILKSTRITLSCSTNITVSSNPGFDIRAPFTLDGCGGGNTSGQSIITYTPTNGKLFTTTISGGTFFRINLRHLKATTSVSVSSIFLWGAMLEDSELDDVFVNGFFGNVRLTGNGSNARGVRNTVHNSRFVGIPNLAGAYGFYIDHVADTHLTDLQIGTTQDNALAIDVILDTGVDGFWGSSVNTAQGKHGFLFQNTQPGYSSVYDGSPVNLKIATSIADTTPGGSGWYFDASLGTDALRIECTSCDSNAGGLNGAGATITAGANGLDIQGGSDIHFIGGYYRVNAEHGINCNSGGSTYEFTAMESIGNLNGNGFAIGTGKCDKTSIIGGKAEANGSAGIGWGGAISNVTIIGINLAGNTPMLFNGGVTGDSVIMVPGVAATVSGSLALGANAVPVNTLDVRGDMKLGSTGLAFLALGDPGAAVGAGTGVGCGRGDATWVAAGTLLHCMGNSGIRFWIGGTLAAVPASPIIDLNATTATINGDLSITGTCTGCGSAVGAVLLNPSATQTITGHILDLVTSPLYVGSVQTIDTSRNISGYTYYIDGTQIVTHGGALQNLTADAGLVTSGIFAEALIPIQRVNGFTSCTTGTVLLDTCGTTVTWPTAFADTNYTAVCTIELIGANVPFVVGYQNKVAASINVIIGAATAAAAQGTINCIAEHN